MSHLPDPKDYLANIKPASEGRRIDEDLFGLRPERRRQDRRQRQVPVAVERRKHNRRAVQITPDQPFKGVAAIIDDTPIFGLGLSTIVKDMGIRTVGPLPSPEGLATQVGDRLDMVIVSHLDLDPLTVIDRVKTLPGQGNGQPASVLMILATLDPANLRKLLSRSVHGIIERSASVEDVQATIARILSGDRVIGGRPLAVLASAGLNPVADDTGIAAMANPLTPKEMEVLTQLALHGTNRDIAQTLCISEATVKTHLASIYSKLNVSGRREAVLQAVERGLLQ